MILCHRAFASLLALDTWAIQYPLSTIEDEAVRETGIRRGVQRKRGEHTTGGLQ
jgi:hypothetical protein